MFENILGHEEIKIYLENIINSNNISHAYLFEGKTGIGKYTIAQEFAKKILNVSNLESCSDYKYINRNEDKKDISVEQIRKSIIDDVYIAPAMSQRKVYIIDDAQNLNTASQNALLKTLEEPPTYVVIILISNSSNTFLPTILSRVTKVTFNSVDSKNISKYVKDKYDTQLDDKILSYIDGSFKMVDSIIQDKLNEKFAVIDELYETIIKHDNVGSLTQRENIDFLDSHVIDYFENLFYINNKYSAIQFIEKAKQRLKYNGNYDIVIDNMILNIIENS